MDPARTARRIGRSLRHRGGPASVAMVFEEVLGTARYGTATRGTVPVDADGDPDRHALETVRFRTLRRALARVPAECRTGLVDLGCGHGRVLVVAARAGYSPVIGVEISAAGVEVAVRATRSVGASVVLGDAGSYPVPDAIRTIFLGNPFGPRTLGLVADRLDEAQRRCPRPLAIVYVNPVHRAVLEARGFVVVSSDPDAIVMTRRPHR